MRYPILVALFLMISCSDSIKKSEGKNDVLVEEVLVAKDSVKAIPLKDTLLFDGKYADNIVKFTNQLTKKITIKDKFWKGKILLDSLNFFTQINGGYQTLNDQNKIVYYDEKFRKIKMPVPYTGFLEECGSVPVTKFEIYDEGNYYLIKKTEGFAGIYSGKTFSIDTIVNENIEDLCFFNGNRVIENEGALSSYTGMILIKFDNGFGIRKDRETQLFEDVNANEYPIKVMRDNLYGYYETTKSIKYKELGPFEYNLAPFTLVDGRKGHIDMLGNEFFATEVTSTDECWQFQSK